MIYKISTSICSLAVWITLSFSALQAQSVEIDSEGFKTFKMVDKDTTYTMKQYFFGLIKRGPIIDQPDSLLNALQGAHLAYMDSLAQINKLHLAGPFGHDGEYRGLVVYNVTTYEEARRLANNDPMAKVGRFYIEVYPWWAAKGASLK